MQTLWVDRMIGKQATIPDIVLQELVQPIDLYCHEEELPELPELPDEEEVEKEEESEYIPYKIIVSCGGCEVRLRMYVLATNIGIRAQQELLLGEVKFLCPDCRDSIRHGQ